MRALVTGASGFIGSHLVRRLVGAGHEVRALVRPDRDPGRLASEGVEIAPGDVRHPADLERALAGRDVVFHLARVRNARRSAPAGLEVHREVAAMLADLARRAGVARLVFTSSTTVYAGSLYGARDPAIDETTPPQAATPYARAKLATEEILLERHHRDGLPVVVARLATVFGPGVSSWRGLFDAIASGRFRLVGAGENRLQPVDVADIVAGLVRSAEVSGIEGRTYILAGDQPTTLATIVRRIGDAFGVSTTRAPIPRAALRAYARSSAALHWLGGRELPRMDRVRLFLVDRSFDIGRARSELGYKPEVRLGESIIRTATWYRSQAPPPP